MIRCARHKMSAITLLTVTDLHSQRGLYADLAKAVEDHRPDAIALVGDFLDMFQGPVPPDLLDPASCARALARLPCPEMVFVRGNHEGPNWRPFAEAWRAEGRKTVALHGETCRIGRLHVLGFPSLMGEETTFLEGRPPLPPHSDDWLPKLLDRVGPAARALWLMHEPPTGTPLSAEGSVVGGNAEWRHAIELHAPQLVVFGHDHRTPVRTKRWHYRLGSTTCVNVGQSAGRGLRFCLVKARFDGEANLPTSLEVKAFPLHESIFIESGS